MGRSWPLRRHIVRRACVVAFALQATAIAYARADDPSPAPAGSMPPSPALSPASAAASPCAQPNREAAVDGKPASADYPILAREEGETGFAVIRVGIAADGTVASASVYRSSGFPLLDRSALAAATKTHYRAEVYRCTPTAGVYLFSVGFTGRSF